MKRILVFSLAFFLTAALSAFAGDSAAQQFIAAGREVVAHLRQHPDSRILDVDALERAVERVKVTSADGLTLHGSDEDAINYPNEDHIDVNRARWENLAPDKRAALALHEYLGILGVDDSQYKVSGPYSEVFSPPAEAPKKFRVTVGAMYGFTLNGTHLRGTHAPGISASLDYALDTRSSVFLNYSRQKINYGEFGSVTDNLVSLGYKYWLNESEKFRPWVQVAAGYVWEHSEDTWQIGQTSWGDPTYAKYENTTGDFQFSVGGGARYELNKNLGLDASVLLYKAGAPWHWSYTTKLITTSLGVDVLF